MIQKHTEQIQQQQILVCLCNIFPMFMFVNCKKCEFGRSKCQYEYKYWNVNDITVANPFQSVTVQKLVIRKCEGFFNEGNPPRSFNMFLINFSDLNCE